MPRRHKKRKTSRTNLKRIRDYARLNAPEPEVLKVAGKESRKRGTDKMSSREIDTTIRNSRAGRSRTPKI